MNGCSICDSDRADIINSLLVAGRTPNFIEKHMKEMGKPTKAETVRRHLGRCLNSKPASAGVGPKGQVNSDFARAVRDTASKMLEDGDLRIRTEHGLTAQALLDRREEKAADRQLMTELARLMSGSRPGIEAPDDMIVVGEWVEVEDKPEQTALAPLALVAGD